MSYVYLQMLATFTACSFVGSKTWEELYFSITENYLTNLLRKHVIVTHFLLRNPMYIIKPCVFFSSDTKKLNDMRSLNRISVNTVLIRICHWLLLLTLIKHLILDLVNRQTTVKQRINSISIRLTRV